MHILSITRHTGKKTLRRKTANLTCGELKSTIYKDSVSGPGLGGEDSAVLHDDLRIQRPPGARTLLRQHMHSHY